MKNFSFLLLAFLAINAALAKNKLTPELLWDLDRVGSPVVSPNGEWVAYTVTDYSIEKNKGLTNIYLKKADGGEAKNLTESIATSCWGQEWRPDGSAIGYMGIAENGVQLFELNISTEKTTQITNVEGGITGFHYAPSGNKIGYSANVKLDKTTQDRYPDLPLANGRVYDELMYRHWDAWTDHSYSHIFVQDYANGKLAGQPLDILKGQRYDSPLNPFGGSEEWGCSPDGK
ncbi:MAG: hypothetical protein KDC92_16015 [Bacteroidetes bacterium]|nr:hypothetical protein [Bacteroidota bacterium]